MDIIAMWIGYIVMAAAGAGAVIGVWWWVMQAIWTMHTRTLNSLDLIEAAKIWKREHPEKWARAARRNGWSGHDEPPAAP